MTSMAAATGKQLADTTNVGEVFKGQGMSFSYSKVENQNGTPFENEKNASLNSPCRSLDPVRKKMFKITSVKKGASGDVLTDNDADSVDGLDESQTEDFSSEFYDNSKVSDLDMDIQDCLNLPLSPDDVMGASITTTILVKQSQKPPDQNCQSRFKVVKIETKEPFRRGKWICYDFYDTTSVTLERTDSKVMEMESNVVPQVSLSGNINSLSSTLDNVGSTSSNTVILPISPVGGEGHAAHFGFVPIQPAPANQVLNQLDGLSSDGMAPFIAQQVLMTEVGVPPSSNSFHNLAQTGHPTIMAHSNIFPYDQNGPTVGMFQNGLSDGIHIPSDTISITSSGASTMLPTVAPATNLTSVAHHNQTLTTSNGIQVIHTSPSQTQIGGDTVEAYDVSSMTESGPGVTHFSHSKTDTVIATGLGITDPLYPTTAESSERITALQGVAGANPSERLKEAVEVVGGMYIKLGDVEDDHDDGEGSSVAIDNKIEQAMDLVKRHLMYAVREEVEILKQQIGELVERIGHLEYENTVLRSEAKPETLNKLLQTRVSQTPQTSLPAQSSSFTISQSSQQSQQTTTPHSVSQVHPSPQSQQTTTPHSVSQAHSSQQSQQLTAPHPVSQAHTSQQSQQSTSHPVSQVHPSQQSQQTTSPLSVSLVQPSQQTST